MTKNKRNTKGRPKGVPNKVTQEARTIAQKLLSRPKYQKMLQQKLDEGTLHPSVEAMLYYYAYGKPKEVIESNDPIAVRIVHQFASEAPDAATPNSDT